MRVSSVTRSPTVKLAGLCLAANLSVLVAASAAPAAAASSGTERLQEAWQDTIIKTPAPDRGCFTASYPVLAWQKVACGVAPNIPLIPRTGRSSRTVGDGNDDVAVVTGLISQTVGTFPTTKGLKTETGDGSANQYTLQINSQFFASPACSGAKDPQSCLGWEQFVYFTGYGVFMQYWLINYNTTCPKGYFTLSPDCYKNSSMVSAPTIPIKQLKTLKLSGSAVANGIDTVTFTTKTKAYTTTGEDSVVDLAAYWNQSEWNVFGPGGGSEATFNKGTTITVNIALTDGSTTAPTCESGVGYTGETNNLNLGSCVAAGGSTPSVKFTESLAK